MGYNPENLEKGNKGEQPPPKRPSEKVVRGLGHIAAKNT